VTRTRSPSYTVVDVFTEPLSGNSLAVFPEASEFDAAGETIVVILADTGERYIGTRLFAEGTPKI
jgi:predicted PhzF superfamily epimerase YddE/YHI9